MTSLKTSRTQRERVPRSLADGKVPGKRVIKQKAVSEKTKSKQQKTKTKTTMKTKVTTPARRSRLSAATAQATLLEVMTGTHDAACYYCG